MAELPDDVVAEAERLTRLARDVPNPDEATVYRQRRDELLDEHGYTSRLRTEDETLVLYPLDWVEDGAVRTERIDDISRALEVSLTGAGEDDEWTAVEEHNTALVEQVAAKHGPDHAANARIFADFMGNHYVRRVETASGRELKEFLTEYYERNAWPTSSQKSMVAESLRLLFDSAGSEVPDYS